MEINEVFRALADPSRREILRMLKEHDLSAGEIAEGFSLSKSTLSGHLSVLRHAGLVVSERHANRIVYGLNLSVFEEAAGAAMALLSSATAGRRVKRKRAKGEKHAIQLAR